MKITYERGSLPGDDSGHVGWHAALRKGRKLMQRLGYFGSREEAERAVGRYLFSLMPKKAEHLPRCARSQFWDAGEYDAPCTCHHR